MDDEFERFKREINLVDFAREYGFDDQDPRDRSRSTSSSVLMRDGNDVKIAVSRDPADGHWVYWNRQDDADQGSIIDFVQKRKRLTFGEVRKELRPWVSQGHRPPQRRPVRETPVEPAREPDRPAVAERFQLAREVANSLYLNGRGLKPETLRDERFLGKWREDGRGNVLFPHQDRHGLCGFEVKNRGFTGFSPGGTKGVWVSKAKRTDNRLALTEAAIDALSLHQLRPDPRTRYMSTGGSPSPLQLEVISQAIARMPPGSTIVSAFDNDPGGHRLAERVKQLAPTATFERLVPSIGKDWNDVVQHNERAYIEALARPPRSRGRGGPER